MTAPVIRTGPGPAERARTVLSHALTSVLHVGPDLSVELDVVAVDADGSLVLLVEADGPLADRLAGGPRSGTLCSALVSPVPGPDRLLDTVVAGGVVELADDVSAALEVVLDAYADQPVDLVLRPEASALVRMSVNRLTLDGGRVDVVAYAAAVADPLAPGSDELVGHLLRDHPDAVVQLAHLLDHEIVHGATGVAPVRVDRFGLTLRVDGPAGTRRARLDFPAPLTSPEQLPIAMRLLQDRASRVAVCPFDDAAGRPA